MKSEPNTLQTSHDSTSRPTQNQHVQLGAFAVTLLLSDHKVFGFSERACYHFDLMETLTQTPEAKNNDRSPNKKAKSNVNLIPPLLLNDNNHDDGKTSHKSDSIATDNHGSIKQVDNDSVPTSCGVVALLECITAAPIKQNKKRKKLSKKIKDFNKQADDARNKYLLEGKNYCHQPYEFPLHLSFNTRVAFAYEMTRIVFCIDASPTLTATFGNLGNVQQAEDGAICAIDRLDNMTRLFFRGLVQPIKGISKCYEKSINGSSQGWRPDIAVTVVACYPKSLVPIDDEETFSLLVSDYRFNDTDGADFLCDKISAWVNMEVENSITSKFSRTGGRLDSTSSSLNQIIETCEACDSATLPPEARPCFVVATDCRAIDCDSVMDIVQNEKLKDTPLHVLDLSGNKTHHSRQDIQLDDDPFYLTYDHDGPSSFPLSITDDSEALYNVCRSTRGYFLDAQVLKGAYNAVAGEETSDSAFHDDIYFSGKRRTMKPNGIQWYIVFSLSPCCPLLLRGWGNAPSPNYIQHKKETLKQPYKSMLLSYSLSPIRVKSILILRIMDGFRTKKYGSNSQDADKVSILFTLNIELGLVIQYELSFVSSRYHNAKVGNALIKISLMGDSSLIQMVKRKYILNELNRHVKKSSLTTKDIVSNKICSFLKGIRDEDTLESSICPLDWDGKLADGCSFVSCLRSLNLDQLYRHFRLESFEIMSVLPQDADTGDYQSNYRVLTELISNWSSKTIIRSKLYIRQLPTTEGDLTNYCLIEVTESELNLRLSTINLHFFEQVDCFDRISCIESLRQSISSCTASFLIAPRSYGKFISMYSNGSAPFSASNLFQVKHWELQNDSELVPLITKRRCQFEQFSPILVSVGCTVLVKFVIDASTNVYMLQYRLRRIENKVLVDVLMDHQRGDFSKAFNRFSRSVQITMFTEIYNELRERDEQCAKALCSRRNLLNLFNEQSKVGDSIKYNRIDDIERLIAHGTKFNIVLRFFNEDPSGAGLPVIANEILEALTTKFMLSDDLSIEVIEASVGTTDYQGTPGKWYLGKSKDDTLCILHFPTCQRTEKLTIDDNVEVFRNLQVFMITSTNLSFDDFVSDTEHVSENDNFVSNLSEEIKHAHGYNYSLASYLALRDSKFNDGSKFLYSDFEYALSYCKEHQITNDIEIKSDIEAEQVIDVSFETKLLAFISEVLEPVPGGSPYFYFDGKINEQNEITVKQKSDHDKENFDENNIDFAEPVYVTFTLDGNSASLQQLRSFSMLSNHSGVLNAFITTFHESKINFTGINDSTTQLRLHDVVAFNLVMKLNSFVAEQTLERLWNDFKTVNMVDYNSVKRCLLEADNVVLSTIPVHFYFSKTDSMLDASTNIGMEGDFSSKFSLLCTCISQQKSISMDEVSSGEFFASNVKENGWCLVVVPETYGFISVNVYHPSGNQVAEKVAMTILRAISDSCHCANQILLLEHMHITRTASSLMIPELSQGVTHSEASNSSNEQQENNLEYPAGYFQCNVSFKTSYELNKRCQLSKVIIDLEASILHSFALSNRPGFFVYKDEEDCVFYMTLQSQQGIDDCLDRVHLVVYGIRPAGPSITIQLHKLLQKRIMLIVTKTISLVLTKNTHYQLWDSDIKFINDFEETWKTLDDEETDSVTEMIYAFPSAIHDPVLILVDFRQNISGSTFFNHSTDSESKGYIKHTEDEVNDFNEDMTGIPFTFTHTEFDLCYNASQFQIGKFQTASTLTEVGKSFRRQAGTGVALIEIKLLDNNKNPINHFQIGKVPDQDTLSPEHTESLKFHRVQENEDGSSRYYVSVRIVNTTLKANALHKWIELTLNQSVSSWYIERHLELAKRSKWFKPTNTVDFSKIMHHSLNLPHPAMKQVLLRGNVQSTKLSKLTFDVLECLVSTIFEGKKYPLSDIDCLQIARFCGKSTPQIVKLLPLTGHQSIEIVDSTSKEIFHDNPALNLQYVSSFGLSLNNESIDEKIRKTPPIPTSSFLFQKLHISDDNAAKGTLSHALSKLIISNPGLFSRHIAFLVVVTRTSTLVLLYNLNPKIYDILIPRLQDKFNEVNTLKNDQHQKSKSTTPEVASSKATTNSTSILMPTIVGKSVQGSAIQAMAMSRARARATTGRPGSFSKGTKLTTGSSPATTRKVMQRSSAKAPKVTNITRPEKANINEMLKRLPQSLAKEYIGSHAQMIKQYTSGNIASMHFQQFFIKWLLKMKGKEIPYNTVDFVLTHSNFLTVMTFPLIQSIVDNPRPFLSFFSSMFMSQLTDVTILSNNFSMRNHETDEYKPETHVIYLMKKCEFSEEKSMIFIYELSIISHVTLKRIGRLRCWSITNNPNKTLMKRQSLFASLNVESEMFNFSLSILRGAIEHHANHYKHNIDISLLLRETQLLFPMRVQGRTNVGKWYRLLYRTLHWNESFGFTIDQFINQVTMNLEEYNLFNFGGSFTCIGGKLDWTTEDVVFFFMPNQNDEMSFDLFIVVLTHQRNFDACFDIHSQTRKSWSEHFFDLAKTTLLKIIHKASKDFLRDQIWVEQSDWV